MSWENASSRPALADKFTPSICGFDPTDRMSAQYVTEMYHYDDALMDVRWAGVGRVRVCWARWGAGGGRGGRAGGRGGGGGGGGGARGRETGGARGDEGCLQAARS